MKLIRTGAIAILAGSLVTVAAPAFAWNPGWEPGGYTPSCAYHPAPLRWIDGAAPTISSITTVPYIAQGISKPTTPVVLGTVTATDPCSGVLDVRYRMHIPDSFVPGTAETVTRYAWPAAGTWHQTTMTLLTRVPWNVYGPLVINRVDVRDRLDDFILNTTHTAVTDAMVGSRTRTSTTPHTVLLMRRANLRALIQPTGGVPDSTITIHPGQHAIITGTMKFADCDADCGYGSQPGTHVVTLQWRQAGHTTWSSIAHATLGASGFSFTRSPSASGSYRVWVPGEFHSPWLAPATTTSLNVSVLP